jgi:hypothetical protein
MTASIRFRTNHALQATFTALKKADKAQLKVDQRQLQKDEKAAKTHRPGSSPADEERAMRKSHMRTNQSSTSTRCAAPAIEFLELRRLLTVALPVTAGTPDPTFGKGAKQHRPGSSLT